MSMLASFSLLSIATIQDTRCYSDLTYAVTVLATGETLNSDAVSSQCYSLLLPHNKVITGNDHVLVITKIVCGLSGKTPCQVRDV